MKKTERQEGQDEEGNEKAGAIFSSQTTENKCKLGTSRQIDQSLYFVFNFVGEVFTKIF